MPKFAANLTMLFTEVDFLDRFEAAAKAGFKGVEYLFPYPYPKEALAERLARCGLTQVLHNLPAGDWAKGGAESPACQAGKRSSATASSQRLAMRRRSTVPR
jgi:hydroxypyruvate isomerase